MTTIPKPPLWLTTFSILVIVLWLYLIALGIAAVVISWDPIGLLGVAILLPTGTVLALLQYRGAFLGVRLAARTAGYLLIGFGAVAAFAFASTLAEAVAANGAVPWLGLLVPLLVCSAVCTGAGLVNMLWSSQLPRVVGPDRLSTFTLREFGHLLAAVCFICIVAIWLVFSASPRFAEQLESDVAGLGLPDHADDICYCRGPQGTIAYEFDTDERAFREWIAGGIGSLESAASETRLVPIQTPVAITRYCAFSLDLPGEKSANVRVGLHYSWTQEDRGVHAVFDSSTNRAYYYAHFH